uniref:Fe2OG dioxygenase domain-containing protein n=1 Tax=Haptolina brevifila TaxID=156173 RepID=A0A7S2FN77_9EUKA|mmetsp:Transcript_15258/g.30630  ORF Transcript_15258/g.30630 Transcript_15258/m.30630 type:complete len:204 (+) Transcript_15258:251-862(+)
MRRAVAIEYGLPLASLSPRQTFVSRVSTVEDLARTPFSIHVDECSVPAYHYSAVLYLSVSSLHPASAGAARDSQQPVRAEPSAGDTMDFTGGELRFHPTPVQESQLVLPRQGMAAIFSSGWENVHEVQPVLSGVRYAMPAFFTTEAPSELAPWDNEDATPARSRAARAAALWRHGLMPDSDKAFFQFLRRWARLFDAEQWASE